MPLILDDSPTTSEIDLPDPREERRRLHHDCEVLIVGAGILGSALATTLARQGRSVILLEKSLKQPDRIVGELLQPGGVQALEKLGLRDCIEGIEGIQVEGYEIIYHGESVVIPYAASRDFNGRGLSEGKSFHHGRFVQKLREAAMAEKNVTAIESTAVNMIRDEWTGQVLGVEAKTKGEKDVYFGSLTIICDGYASTFRKLATATPAKMPSKASLPAMLTRLRPFRSQTSSVGPVTRSKFYALELHDLKLPSPRHGHVILSDFAPVLLYQISPNTTRALIDVPTAAQQTTASVAQGGVKGHLRRCVLPTLPPGVQPSFDAALSRAEAPTTFSATETTATTTPAPLRSMPNSFLPSHCQLTPGLALLGDAHNMRHPLTGGGMTVALTDVVVLSTLLSPDAIRSFNDIPAVQKAFRTFHWRRKRTAAVINILAQALYSLFAADDTQLRALQRGCFEYLSLGGEYMGGPVGLLAGLTKRPEVLVFHFFSVAIYAIGLFILGLIPEVNTIGKDAQNGVIPNGNAAGSHSQKAKPRKVDIIGMPRRIILSPAIFWKACVVIVPYMWAEVAG